MTDGILVVNKPAGCTSRDVVNKVSKILKIKKIGHTGTLDPIASGVLVLTIGRATKLSDILMSNEKKYIATAIFGIETDTLDVEGKVLKEENIKLTKEQLENALNSFQKTYLQQVPIYSAVKVNGKKLYDYARNNEFVELPSKMVTIKEIDLIDITYENNKTIVKFSCLVSKGTYIRSLIRDIATSLNTIAIMSDLIRTKQGNFEIKDSYTLEQIENNTYKYIDILSALSDYYIVDMDEKLEYKIRNGVVIDNVYNKDYVLFKSANILALYKKVDNKLKPFKMFL